ncbi:MAG: nucleotidyltransferase domain-containing protein, partial [Pseudobdellovibrionaceae bacterium]
MKQKIVDHLVVKYHPKAIILHGSRVEGLNRPNSDWDILVISKSGVQGKTEIFEGQSL